MRDYYTVLLCYELSSILQKKCGDVYYLSRLDYGMDDQGSIPGHCVQTGSVGPTQPLIQRVPGVNRPGCEVDHSLLSSAEVKNRWRYTSTPAKCLHGAAVNKWPSLHAVVLKHRDNVSFTFKRFSSCELPRS